MTGENVGPQWPRSGRNKESALQHFEDLVGRAPYPWQRHLYHTFTEGNVPGTLNIPTGLGKTSCVLLFLLARLERPALPRRIVYIVDRRAIVDQTARAIQAWIDGIALQPTLAAAFDEGTAFGSDCSVQLGVLRGGLADDGQWRIDPA